MLTTEKIALTLSAREPHTHKEIDLSFILDRAAPVPTHLHAVTGLDPYTASRIAASAARSNGQSPHLVVPLLPHGHDGNTPASVARADIAKLCEEYLAHLPRTGDPSLWQAIASLLADEPQFRDAGIGSLLQSQDEDITTQELLDEMMAFLDHDHVLILHYFMTAAAHAKQWSHLVIDQPERHLRPSELSLFLRLIRLVCEHKGCLAIFFTNSPLVLQEIPARCIWQFSSWHRAEPFYRPEYETFCENTGPIMRELNRVELMHTSWYKMIAKTVAANDYDYDRAVATFGDEIGGEGRAIMRALCVNRPQAANEAD